MPLPYTFGPLTGAIPTRYLDANFQYLLALIGSGGGGGTTGVPSGTLAPFAGATAPVGWFFCYGQTVSRTTYAALFAAIGVIYGNGDGSTTFNLPDLRGRAVFGLDNMGGTAAGRLNGAATGGITATTLAATGGEQAHTMASSELVPHNHPLSSGANLGGLFNLGVAGAAIWQTSGGAYAEVPLTNTSNSTGAGTAFNVVPPGMALNWMISQ